MKYKWLALAFVTVLTVITPPAVRAQNVTITPLGAAAGEFCVGDRALLFEDPTGVRVLIAPGRTVGLDTGAFVRGSADPRLQGSVHVLLIDHPHVDHIGDVFHTTCAGAPTRPFEFSSESNAAEIAARLNAAVLVGGEMPDFFTRKIANVATLAGTPQPVGCPADNNLDNTFTVPRAAHTLKGLTAPSPYVWEIPLSILLSAFIPQSFPRDVRRSMVRTGGTMQHGTH